MEQATKNRGSLYTKDIDPRFVPPCPKLDPIKDVARRHGYCVAEHGSKYRDYDLIAVPWVEDAVSPEALIAALCDDLGCFQIGSIEVKPHGRVAVTLQRDKWEKHWDVSIIRPTHSRSVPGEECYIAWLRYVRNGDITRIEVCDSDADGAFRVYRL